jgi:hypothetical protein
MESIIYDLHLIRMPKLNFPSLNLNQELAREDSELYSRPKDLNCSDENIYLKIL